MSRVVTLGLLVAGTVALSTSPAAASGYHPDPPPIVHCATETQYAVVTHHDTLQAVVNELGHRGRVVWHRNIGGVRDQERRFPACEKGVTILVLFTKPAYPKGADPVEYAKRSNFPKSQTQKNATPPRVGRRGVF